MNELLILGSGSGGDVSLTYWLYHDVKELIVGSLASVILFGLLWWKAGPAMKKAFSDRTEGIATEISTAEEARADGEAALAQVQANIGNADAERQRILTEARSTAEQVKASIISRGEQEAVDVRSRATSDISGAQGQITADLQAEVARLALGAAESVVVNSLDASTQSDLIENYISSVGASA